MDEGSILMIVIIGLFSILGFLLCVYIMRWVLHLDGIYKELKVQSKLLAYIAQKNGVDKELIEDIVKKTKV